MEFIHLFQVILLAMVVSFLIILWKIFYLTWFSPTLAHRELQKNGFTGPPPSFPFGNIKEMKNPSSTSPSLKITHDIHHILFPYFVKWRKSYGKVFIYWVGIEPFLYIGDPEFLKKMSSGILAKSWGKVNVFKHYRKHLLGRNGLLVLEGDNWARHRHVITPTFSAANLKFMMSSMVGSTNKMLNKWSALITHGKLEIEVKEEILSTAAEIIGKIGPGISWENGKEVYEKLKTIQVILFKSNRLVGVPFNKIINLKQTLETRKLGKKLDSILLSIIKTRKSHLRGEEQQIDLLGRLLADNQFTIDELTSECKSIFFGGYETSALAITWSLLLLALHPEWQCELRYEIKEVMGDSPALKYDMLARFKKMGWVMNEVLRLYTPVPDTLRQARGDIQVGDKIIIPEGTNIWIDATGMHHDPELWGEDVHEFKPERFKDSIHGGCKHKMGFLPFGFGGRMCVGMNLFITEYKVVLALMLSRFSFSLSPGYNHSPTEMLTIIPSHGLPLIIEALRMG